MKVSVITICLNSAATIDDAIHSVASQDYRDIEYVIVDGGSTDGTREIINSRSDVVSRVVSEPDEGLYDALNKGIRMSCGDVIALLHSDDIYADDRLITKVVEAFESSGAEAVYTDLEYVSRSNTTRTTRLWRAGIYSHGSFLNGWMPPHPALFVKRAVYDRCGLYNTSFRISADYEFMLRAIHKYGIDLHYLPITGVKMRVGGRSNISLGNRLLANREDRKAWRINGLHPHWYTTLLKPLSKIRQFRFWPGRKDKTA